MASLMANQNAVITLGNFNFNLTAVPDKINGGIKEQMNVHKLIGGARVIDMIGDDPSDYSWCGWFLGPNSTDKINELYQLTQNKEQIELTFGEIQQNVVISSMEFVYKRKYWIEYVITCVVVPENEALGGGIPDAAGIDAAELNNGNDQIANANANVNNNPADAAANLNAGVAGLQITLQAGGFTLPNLAVNFG